MQPGWFSVPSAIFQNTYSRSLGNGWRMGVEGRCVCDLDDDDDDDGAPVGGSLDLSDFMETE